jgi:hypothetical protein
MEKNELLERWEALVHEGAHVELQNKRAAQALLQERLIILHRLNELGEYVVDGTPIGQALEDTNVLLREVDRVGYPVSAVQF